MENSVDGQILKNIEFFQRTKELMKIGCEVSPCYVNSNGTQVVVDLDKRIERLSRENANYFREKKPEIFKILELRPTGEITHFLASIKDRTFKLPPTLFGEVKVGNILKIIGLYQSLRIYIIPKDKELFCFIGDYWKVDFSEVEEFYDSYGVDIKFIHLLYIEEVD